MEQAKTLAGGRDLSIPICFLLVLTLVLLANAWIVDDAYITFRTVDNFRQGHGLTWNPEERVQVYTHPLWMLLVSLFYLITSEFFFTVIVLSVLLTAASVCIVWATVTHKFLAQKWKGLLLVFSLISSKAFVDYASSGLENSLSYLIASVFLLKFLPLRQKQQVDDRRIGIFFFLASLAFLNRADTILLYLPALLYLLYSARFMSKLALGRSIVVATLPATLWVLFSLLYYGFPFPNTAYAKVFATGFPLAWTVHRGFEYLANSFSWDTASYVLLCSAIWISLKKRSPMVISVMVGIVLYILFVVCSGASATHMSGRFFSVPFFMAIILLVNGISNRWLGFVGCASLAVYMAWSPISAVKFGTPLYRAYPQKRSYVDTKWGALNEGAALINWRPGKKMPDHIWYRYGEKIKRQSAWIHVGGAFGGEAIGFAGFAAGPEKYLIDRVGLGDPLLARLPAVQPSHIDGWKSGHFHRRIPAGYVETHALGKNMLREAGIRLYYDYLHRITRGPLFRWDRLIVILKINLGRYQPLLAGAIRETVPIELGGERVPHNEQIEARIQKIVSKWDHTDQRNMFGGVCHLLNGNMFCGVYKDFLILRLGEENGTRALAMPHVRPFDITGRPMKGWVMVGQEGFQRDDELANWLGQARELAGSLPAKQ